MNKNTLLTILVILFSNSVFCQNLSPKELSEKIFSLNNDHNYHESIVLLEKIINDPKSTKYDLYNAYLQKSFTYKRLYNYSQASNNLQLALKEGLLSERKDEATTRVLIEQLFINFDLLKFKEVEILLSKIRKENINLIEAETRANYIAVVAVMYIRKKDFLNAEIQLDKAIKILEEEDPKHLPNIYRKKMGLYNHTKEENKVMEAFEAGLSSAKKFKSDIYELIMYETLTSYYSENDDYENAFFNQKKVSALRTKYNAENQSGKLHILEKDLIGKRNSLQLRYEKKYVSFLRLYHLF